MYSDVDQFDSSHGRESSETQPDLGNVLVVLLKGVLYQDSDPKRWLQLLNLQSSIRDYVTILDLELILDEAEGFAFLRSRREENERYTTDEIPRLVTRRQLSFPVSLLLALLRKKMAEFDASGGETRLVLTREDITDLIRLFLPDSSNEAKLVDQIERHLNKVLELGFLRKLKPETPSSQPAYEVRRILKAFVDAQWLSEFDARLEEYRQKLRGSGSDE